MQPMFPCPNPNCRQTFSSEALQGVSSLVCPLCGMSFRISSRRSASARSSGAAEKPAPPPLPKTVPPEMPAEESIPTEPPLPELVTPSLPWQSGKRDKRRRMGWIVGVVAGAICVALAVWGGLWLQHFLNENTSEKELALGKDFNARFVPPGKPWLREKAIQQRLHVHIAMKSPAHQNCLAILFKDYKDRMPSDAEMLDEALAKLSSCFQGLEKEVSPPDEQTRLADHPAQVCTFQGEDAEHVTMNGECYMMAFRGYGYWFFTWAPLGELESDRDAIHSEWTQLRQRFHLLDGRKSWKEKRRESARIAGKKAKYSLALVKGVWTPEAAGDEDPNVDLLLRGQEPDSRNRPLASKSATVQVLVLPSQPDLKAATAAALGYVKQREMKLYEQMTWKPIEGKDGAVDRDADIGAEHGHLSKMHVKCTEDLERYLAIAVVKRPRGVVVLVGDCLWERREFWDQEFMALFKSFTAH